MNPITNMKNLNKMNDRELEMGVAGTSKSWHNQYDDSAWVFVGGLPYDLTEGDIVCVFSQYGEIVHINLVRDQKTGKSKGFAFVCYEDQRSTILCVDNLNGMKVCGRLVRVDHVHTYKLPKDLEKMDEDRKKLFLEGCAPQPIISREQEEEPEPEKKKDKKKKKKKKKKKSKSSSDEDSSDSSSERDKRKRRSSRSKSSEVVVRREINQSPERSNRTRGIKRERHPSPERNRTREIKRERHPSPERNSRTRDRHPSPERNSRTRDRHPSPERNRRHEVKLERSPEGNRKRERNHSPADRKHHVAVVKRERHRHRSPEDKRGRRRSNERHGRRQ